MAKTPKRTPLVSYTCGLCPKKCEAQQGSILLMLQLCEGCQAKRFAAGTAELRKAEAREAAHG